MLTDLVDLSQRFALFFSQVYDTLTTRIDALPTVSSVGSAVLSFFTKILEGLGIEPTLLALILFSGGAVIIVVSLIGWILKAIPVV